MFEEPELHLVSFSGGERWRAERDRQRAESRRRHHGQLALTLIELGLPARDAPVWADALLDRLFVVIPVEGGDRCSCSCHPQLPMSDLHDHGASCSCQRTAEQRRRWWDDWRREQDAYRNSPAGAAQRARAQAAEDQLAAWLAVQPDVVISSYGGLAPEQWRGSVTGHSFYFRERHDCWRIELDLRPSGRFTQTWQRDETEDGGSFQPRELGEGDVIAEGVLDVDGYGDTPVERAEFIVGVIRAHLGRAACTLHRGDLADLERRLDHRPGWCPDCGTGLD